MCILIETKKKDKGTEKERLKKFKFNVVEKAKTIIHYRTCKFLGRDVKTENRATEAAINKSNLQYEL